MKLEYIRLFQLGKFISPHSDLSGSFVLINERHPNSAMVKKCFSSIEVQEKELAAILDYPYSLPESLEPPDSPLLEIGYLFILLSLRQTSIFTKQVMSESKRTEKRSCIPTTERPRVGCDLFKITSNGPFSEHYHFLLWLTCIRYRQASAEYVNLKLSVTRIE